MIKTIIWDFDGVILDSNAVRDKGFVMTLSGYPSKQVDALLHYHRENGGLSRYHKFRYFFEEIRGEQVTEEQIKELAHQFSVIMMKELAKPELLIEQTNSFIEAHHEKYNMHIVSGSDQEELRKLCSLLGIDQFFKSIEGSPTPKIDLVANILRKEKYDKNRCLLIGDSINDYEAAFKNKIHFQAFGNKSIENKSTYKLL